MRLKNLKTNNYIDDKKLIVQSRTENLSVVRDYIHDAALKAGINPEKVGDIILAVDEACTTIIKHAYKSIPDGKIEIQVLNNHKKFTIVITDYGSSFEPQKVPSPDLQKYYQQHRVGGLGMYLMKNLMDEVDYISVPGKYNRVSLSKNLNTVS
jgi:serine/threonine-protein kinase RsbW